MNIKYRHAVHCYKADTEYGERFAKAAGLDSRLSEMTDYLVTRHRTVFEGLCPACPRERPEDNE